MGWWIFRAGTAIFILWWTAPDPGETCWVDPNPEVQAVYCE